MLKKSLIGLLVVALAGGGYFGYSQYQVKIEAEKRKVAEDIARLVAEQRKEQLTRLKEERAEQEQDAIFAKEHYPKVLNGTGIIETKEFIDDNGVKRAEYQLVDGSIGGKYTLWRKDGTKQEEGFLLTAKAFENERFIKPAYFGEKFEFGKKGFLEEKRIYDNTGKLLSKYTFYPDGTKKSSNEDGKVKQWYSNGAKKYLGEGNLSIYWYQDGQIMEKSRKNDVGRHGWAEYWYANGTKKCEGEYDSSGLWYGDRVGVWKKWDEDGKLVAEGYFSDNKLDKSKPYLGTEVEIKECSKRPYLYK